MAKPATYTVVWGDSLYGIAAKTGVSITTLLSLNGLKLTSFIYPGMVLKLRSTTTTATTKPVTTTTKPPLGTWVTLRPGSTGPRVVAVQRALMARGIVVRGGADGIYGYYTTAAVRLFQSRVGLPVTGIVDAATAKKLGVSMTTTTPPPPTTTASKGCPTSVHGAVVDRRRQRAWLCYKGKPLSEFVMTSARTQPDPGRYRVYSKSVNAYSWASGSYTTMQYFTAFARGEQYGARVGFHSVPRYRSGAFIQPLSSVGTLAMFGRTAGCLRVLPNQAQVIYRWLAIGDTVVVIS